MSLLIDLSPISTPQEIPQLTLSIISLINITHKSLPKTKINSNLKNSSIEKNPSLLTTLEILPNAAKKINKKLETFFTTKILIILQESAAKLLTILPQIKPKNYLALMNKSSSLNLINKNLYLIRAVIFVQTTLKKVLILKNKIH